MPVRSPLNFCLLLDVSPLTFHPEVPRLQGEESPMRRFCAGVIVRSPNGYPLGSICVLDTDSRVLSDAQKRQINVRALRRPFAPPPSRCHSNSATRETPLSGEGSLTHDLLFARPPTTPGAQVLAKAVAATLEKDPQRPRSIKTVMGSQPTAAAGTAAAPAAAAAEQAAMTPTSSSSTSYPRSRSAGFFHAPGASFGGDTAFDRLQSGLTDASATGSGPPSSWRDLPMLGEFAMPGLSVTKPKLDGSFERLVRELLG